MCKELSKELLPGENPRGWGGSREDRQGREHKEARPEPFQARLSLGSIPGGRGCKLHLTPTLGRELAFHSGYQSVTDKRPPGEANLNSNLLKLVIVLAVGCKHRSQG